MGIDFLVKFLDEGQELSTNKEHYLKYLWRDLKWREILGIVGIDLTRLYDNRINYWTSKQITDMYFYIKDLYYGKLENVDRDLYNIQLKELGDDLYYQINIINEDLNLFTKKKQKSWSYSISIMIVKNY